MWMGGECVCVCVCGYSLFALVNLCLECERTVNWHRGEGPLFSANRPCTVINLGYSYCLLDFNVLGGGRTQLAMARGGHHLLIREVSE